MRNLRKKTQKRLNEIIIFSLIGIIVLVIVGARFQPKSLQYLETRPLNLDPRVVKLRNFFQANNSPLTEYAPFFIQEADRYGFDWKLLPAITGVESTYGQFIPYNSFNAYGWGGGKIFFSNWQESISVVSFSLANNYIAKGRNTVEKIAYIYNPVTPREWGKKVNIIMYLIDNYPPNSEEISFLSLDI